MLPMYSNNHYNEKELYRHACFPRRYRFLIRIILPLIGVYLLYLIAYRPENWISDTYPEIASPSHSSDVNWLGRQQQVRKAFQHAWSAYVRDAWGCDEYHPISRRGSNLTTQGIGFTIVDSLDTLFLMNLTDEFRRARNWVAKELDFDIDGEVNLFETTIRVFGGLLSAYNLSGDMEFLSKAVDLADRLLGAFLSPTAIPYASVNLRRKSGVEAHFASGASSTSEVTTLQLEFKYLSHLTGDEKYWKKVEETIFKIDSLERIDGLVPIYIRHVLVSENLDNPNDGLFWGSSITLGARGDSYYEYLLKQYIQTSRTEPMYRRMYDQAMQGVKTRLVGYSRPSKFLFVGELPHPTSTILPKMDHLVCFLGGNLALGATEGHTIRSIEDYNMLSKNAKEDLRIGTELTKTCAQMYFTTATGLAPEIVYFNTDKTSADDLYIKTMDAHSLLRPETVESLFILWRITRDVKYREWGWKIFEAFEKYAKHETGGYTSLDDVTTIPPGRRDKMETFWLAETLKYLYLLFGDTDVLPLDKYVFNTEAHPLPIFMPSEEVRGAGWSRS